MKKKLQQEIMGLVNKLGNENENFNTKNVKEIVHKLYEKLCVLEYLETQINEEKEAQNGVESFDSKSYREKNWFSEPEPVPQPKHKEDLVEPLMEKIKDLVAQMPEESQRVDELLEEIVPKKRYIKNDLEEFASKYQQTPVFERKEQQKKEEKHTATKEADEPQEPSENISQTKKMPVDPDKPRSINDALHRGMNIGLNDRLAFIKHLFNDSTDDFNRVISQINTMDSYSQAQDFIKGKIKPDYNYWLNKDEYANRFMAIIEKSFN